MDSHDSPRPPPDPAGPVTAVANAARILDHLADAGRPLRLTQISRPLGLHNSTCLNILRTLAGAGLVSVEPATKAYGLGRRLVALARGALGRVENIGALRPGMDEVARRHGVTIMLWGRLDPDRLILLAASVGEPLGSVHVALGHSVPLLTGSMGRLFAADVAPSRLRRLFDAVVWQRPLDFATYQAQIAEAAERGWALDAGHQHAAMWGVSVPVAHPGAPLDRVISAVLLADQQKLEAVKALAADLAALGRT